MSYCIHKKRSGHIPTQLKFPPLIWSFCIFNEASVLTASLGDWCLLWELQAFTISVTHRSNWLEKWFPTAQAIWSYDWGLHLTAGLLVSLWCVIARFCLTMYVPLMSLTARCLKFTISLGDENCDQCVLNTVVWAPCSKTGFCCWAKGKMSMQ